MELTFLLLHKEADWKLLPLVPTRKLGITVHMGEGWPRLGIKLMRRAHIRVLVAHARVLVRSHSHLRRDAVWGWAANATTVSIHRRVKDATHTRRFIGFFHELRDAVRARVGRSDPTRVTLMF